ncbi:glycoside hydrolase family 16 protein [Sphaerobolus stellatus SS14]|nr:glycoside hydrolase family 16 protein [Sphaerobolus stellatus SS14]
MLSLRILTHLVYGTILIPFTRGIDIPFPFVLTDTYIGNDFFNKFEFMTIDDPTHGRVNYVSKEEAIQKGLASVQGETFFMRADSKNIIPLSARGRDSIRIQSLAAYTDSIVVLDLVHMPEGCSTWPAFWTLTQAGPWPVGGEIDIIEGVNLNTHNLASLHTSPNCTVPVDPDLLQGTVTSDNCDTQVNFNQGCGANFTGPATYGSPFNKQGGGWYVMERRASTGISVWFWSRTDFNVPPSIEFGSPILEPSFLWGLPQAFFPFSSSCNPNHFDAHNIIFDDTFCGDFAGTVYPTSGCPGTCEDFVNNNPQAFAQAYWQINSLRVYTS